jgi:hypothetical protein
MKGCKMKTIIRLVSFTEAEIYDLRGGQLIVRQAAVFADTETAAKIRPDAILISASLLAWSTTSISGHKPDRNNFQFDDKTAHNLSDLAFTGLSIAAGGVMMSQAWIEKTHLKRLLAAWGLKDRCALYAEPLCLKVKDKKAEWNSGTLTIRMEPDGGAATIIKQNTSSRAQTLPMGIMFDRARGRFLESVPAKGLPAGGITAKLGISELFAQYRVEAMATSKVDAKPAASDWLAIMASGLRAGSLERLEIGALGETMKVTLSMIPKFDQNSLTEVLTDADITWREDSGRIVIEIEQRQGESR